MFHTKHKYGAIKTTVNKIDFASKKEAGRYCELLLLAKAGEIKDLELQPRFVLQDSFKYKNQTVRKIEYLADFQYFDLKTKTWVVEDVKASAYFQTETYKIKKKIFLKLYGHIYDFREIY